MRRDFNSNLWVLNAIVLLLLFRLLVQLALYQAGFKSLTADEFARTIIAASWSKHPTIYWSGWWLPFHAYLHGTALLIKWELLWTPRVLTILIGLVSIVLMYLLASSLFKSKIVGLVSAFLLGVNPAHIWLSGTPLTEMPNVMLIFAAIWAFGLYLQTPKWLYLFTAAFALALANGFRFESWLISVLFTLIIFGQVFFKFIKEEKAEAREVLNLVVAACIPWVFPLFWLIGNYVQTQNPFFFTAEIQAYKLQWYGNDISYGKYLETFLRIDPYLTFLGLIGIAVCLLFNKKSKAVLWYTTVTIIPLALYIILQGGQVEPPGNYIRYFAQYSFLFYPSIGYLFVLSAQSIKPNILGLGLVLLLVLIAITQIRSTFEFSNDPAADGLAVGLAIREIRDINPEVADRPVIIELSYWQYLAVKVGANDIDHIMYDRVPDMSRKSQSLLLTDIELFQFCLKSYNVSYIIVKDPQLRTVVENQLKLQHEKEINSYAFYPIRSDLPYKVQAGQIINCPLSVGTGD